MYQSPSICDAIFCFKNSHIWIVTFAFVCFQIFSVDLDQQLIIMSNLVNLELLEPLIFWLLYIVIHNYIRLSLLLSRKRLQQKIFGNLMKFGATFPG